MIKNISHNQSTGETTVVRTLNLQDEPRGKDTGIKFNHDFQKSISGDSLGINMVITTGTLDADKTNAK